MLNHIVLMGRLVRNPELKTTQSGVSICTFRIASDRDFTDKATGQRDADFVECVAWRGLAEFISRSFAKGRMIVVDGRLQSRNYQDSDGNKRTVYEVNVENAYFADSKRASNTEQATPAATDFASLSEDDADMPF